MKTIIIFAGYSKMSYLRKIRQHYNAVGLHLICVYERQPLTPFKKDFLKLFDESIDLTSPEGHNKDVLVDIVGFSIMSGVSGAVVIWIMGRIKS